MRISTVTVACLMLLPLCAAQGQQTQSSAPPQQAQVQAQAPPNVTRIRVEQSVMATKIIRMVWPVYPERAKMAGISGTVVLHAIIGTDGRVQELQVISGPILLRQAAIDSVKPQKYQPTLLNGQPVEVDTTLSVIFALSSEPLPAIRSSTFRQDVRVPGSGRVVLTESIEIAGATKKQDWADFVSAFVDSTSRAWLNAIPTSTETKKGKVMVEFLVHRDGSLYGEVTITHSSGDGAVDGASRAAIAKAAPFHAFPASFTSGGAQIQLTIAYNHPQPIAPSSGGTP